MTRLFAALVMAVSLCLVGTARADDAVAAPEPSSEHPPEHGADGGHAPSFHDFNWYHGMLWEKEGAEPSLLFRPPGMPVPFAALLLNAALLYYFLYRAFGKSVSEGLKARKQGIMRGMDEAAKMKREAEEQLAFYEAKLASVDQEVVRVQREMRAAGEAERARIVSEAEERRERMQRDALLLIDQELKAVRERLWSETITSAILSARTTLTERLNETDQQRFAEEYLSEIQKSAPALRGRV